MAKSPKEVEAPTPIASTEEVTEPKSTDERRVAIPFDDVTATVTEIDQFGDAVRQKVAEAAAEQHTLPQGRPNAFEGPRGFHDLPDKVAQEIYDYAESENRARTITHDIMASRDHNTTKQYVAPPVPDAIAAQTRLEMEAGKAAVARHAERAQLHPRPQEKGNASMVSVFRPDDYVPDIKKGQGIIPSTSARSAPL